MSAISPGAASNASMIPAVQHEQRASDPVKAGKEKLGLDSSNSSASMAAHSFEQRCSEPGGIQH